MIRTTRRVTFTVIALLAFASLIAGLFVFSHLTAKKLDISQFNGTILQTPRDIKSFSLMGIDKQEFNNSSLQNQWTMIFFGFTQCGSICPTTLAELANMQQLLIDAHVENLPRVVMISVDPERDTIERLQNYVTAFNPHFYGALGDSDSIEALTQELGIAYIKVMTKNNAESENYDIDHSGTIMLFNPQGKLSAFFTIPHQAKALASDYQNLLAFNA